ncbi:MAG: hypothetical protein CBC48_17770 [bacterium TMED88]|nr:hypothetical protein [Deltaproteobacteria bacterium]OUV24147.1 MAG: hypothetical protein CBC48_17770 [bacterium TMED88]
MQPWLARNFVYRPATWVRGEPVFSLLESYKKSQWWSPERHREDQVKKLGHILRHAAQSTTYYRAIAEGLGIAPSDLNASHLRDFPYLQKQHLVENNAALQAWRLPGTTSWKTTGGSTGVAVRLRKNRWATAAEQAASWRSYGWYGLQAGDRQARFWGTPIRARGRARYRAIDWVLNRSRFSAFAFGPKDLDRYYAQLRIQKPHWAYGYVSMLTEFARHCQTKRLPLQDLKIRAVVTTSEMLTEGDRSLIQNAFQAPVYNEYGCGEVGAILYECDRGTLHAMAENLHFELKPDPTEQEPEAHALIVTDLHNLATPLIRYEIGDRVVPLGADCPCGRGLAGFRTVFGRAYDFIETADGTRYHGEFFLYMIEEARESGVPILQAQFSQKTAKNLEIRLVTQPGYKDHHGAALIERVEEMSSHRLKCQVTVVPQLERERSGKLRLIQSLKSA